jgi:DNA-binding HxlR family transcriptional regulator
MTGYGQFCSIARAHEVLGGRWTLLVVRELLCGSTCFNDIRRGIPRISRTMLSERLQALSFVGAVARIDGEHGPQYTLTAGKELAALVEALGTWGQRWLPRSAMYEDNDLEPLLVDMQRRVRFAVLPKHPIVIQNGRALHRSRRGKEIPQVKNPVSPLAAPAVRPPRRTKNWDFPRSSLPASDLPGRPRTAD